MKQRSDRYYSKFTEGKLRHGQKRNYQLGLIFGSIIKTIPCIGVASTPEAGHLVSPDAGGELQASGKGVGSSRPAGTLLPAQVLSFCALTVLSPGPTALPKERQVMELVSQGQAALFSQR